MPIRLYCFQKQFPNTRGIVANQYRGKENLKPIFEKLLSVVKTFGADVVITPKKASVSLIRKKQFALIKPATKTRIARSGSPHFTHPSASTFPS